MRRSDLQPLQRPLMRPHQGPKKPWEFAATETIMKAEMPMMYVLGSSTILGGGGGGGGGGASPPPKSIATWEHAQKSWHRRTFSLH